MIPAGITQVVIFLLLISPGALFNLLSKRYRPAVKEAALQELSRIIITSTITTAVAAAATSWWWIGLAAKHRSGHTDLGQVAAATTVTWILSCATAWGYAKFRHRGQPAAIRAYPALYQVLAKPPQDANLVPVVVVAMADTSIWKGVYYTVDLDEDTPLPVLALQQPLTRQLTPEHPTEKQEQDVAVLPLDQIRSIKITHVDLDTQMPTARAAAGYAIAGLRVHKPT